MFLMIMGCSTATISLLGTVKTGADPIWVAIAAMEGVSQSAGQVSRKGGRRLSRADTVLLVPNLGVKKSESGLYFFQ